MPLLQGIRNYSPTITNQNVLEQLGKFCSEDHPAGAVNETYIQRRKNTANLQTWFGGRFWPKTEEDLVVKNNIFIVGIDLEDKSSINK